jgi:hypothetical protein
MKCSSLKLLHFHYNKKKKQHESVLGKDLFIRSIFGLYLGYPNSEGKFTLTFDDGPTPVTDWVFDQLKSIMLALHFLHWQNIKTATYYL